MTDLLWKALGYRALASVLTISIAWIVSGSVQVGATVGVVEFVVKTLGYMLYESFWIKATADAD